MAEIIMSFVILVLVGLVMIAIGIAQVKSENPVGFYTGEKPPAASALTDVQAWNKKHGYMWITYGVAMIVAYAVGLLMPSEVFAGMAVFLVVIWGIPVMMIYHHHLKNTMMVE